MVKDMGLAPMRREGFTLIELLVVMSIIALLLTLAVPRYFGSLERSKEITLRQNLGVMRDTLEKFYADKGTYPESLEELVTKKYLRAVPVDPITESNTTWVPLLSSDSGKRTVVDVKSGASGQGSDGVSYEKY